MPKARFNARPWREDLQPMAIKISNCLGATIGKCSSLLPNRARSSWCKGSCTTGNHLPKDERRIEASMDC